MGQRLDKIAKNQWFVLAGDGPLVNRTKPAWTVRIGDLGADNASFPPPADMRVVTAYFAASP